MRKTSSPFKESWVYLIKVRHDHLQDSYSPVENEMQVCVKVKLYAVDSSVPVPIGMNAYLLPFSASRPIVFMLG